MTQSNSVIIFFFRQFPVISNHTINFRDSIVPSYQLCDISLHLLPINLLSQTYIQIINMRSYDLVNVIRSHRLVDICYLQFHKANHSKRLKSSRILDLPRRMLCKWLYGEVFGKLFFTIPRLVKVFSLFYGPQNFIILMRPSCNLSLSWAILNKSTSSHYISNKLILIMSSRLNVVYQVASCTIFLYFPIRARRSGDLTVFYLISGIIFGA